MSEEATQAAEAPSRNSNSDDVSYQAVEKEGVVTAIWEMQGQKHLRTIDPRSDEGKQILATFRNGRLEGQLAETHENART